MLHLVQNFVRVHITQREIPAVFGLVADHVLLAEILSFDNDVAHQMRSERELSIVGNLVVPR